MLRFGSVRSPPKRTASINESIPPFSTNPGQLQEVTMDPPESLHGVIPFSMGLRSPGKLSPIRGRTMKEYDEQLSQLKKENFNLKLRIYFLEERMGHSYNQDDPENVHKVNVELKVEMETLKKELADKQELLREASVALDTLEVQYRMQLNDLKNDNMAEKGALEARIHELEKDVASHHEQAQHLVHGPPTDTSTALCAEAFGSILLGHQSEELKETVRVLEEKLAVATHEKEALEKELEERLTSSSKEMGVMEGELEGERRRRQDLEELRESLQRRMEALKREAEERAERVSELEAEMQEKEAKIDSLTSELELRHMELQEKYATIDTLQRNLDQVQPDMESRQEQLEERDRILEEKQIQLEEQNKILVEIQITLDEKQKQIAELEAALAGAQDSAVKSQLAVQGLTAEVKARDREITGLKKEMRKQEKWLKDLAAERKELQEMVNRIKWEAQTSGREDDMKEMAEEENERLWSELEERKRALQKVTAEKDQAVLEHQQQVHKMLCDLQDKEKRLCEEEGRRRQLEESHHAELSGKCRDVDRLERAVKDREAEVAAHEVKLRSLQQQVDDMTQEVQRKNGNLQELVNRELWDKNKEIEKLQAKLSEAVEEKRSDLAKVKAELSDRDDEIRRLRVKLCHDINGEGQVVTLRHQIAPVERSVMHSVNVSGGDVYRDEELCAKRTNGSVVDARDGVVAGEAGTLRLEVRMLRDELQSSVADRQELRNKIEKLKEMLRKSPDLNDREEIETLRGKVKKLESEVAEKRRENSEINARLVDEQTVHQQEVSMLKTEMKSHRKPWEHTISKYQENVRRHKKELAKLKKRLAESHTACDMLRTRLEELADFLELIIKMDEEGLLNLSQLSTHQLSNLQRALTESRELSRTLSQSLMVGVDSLTDAGDISSVSSSVSSRSATWQDSSIATSASDYDHQQDKTLSSVVDVTAELDTKARELERKNDAIAGLSQQLDSRNKLVEDQCQIITKLRSQVELLQEEVKRRDIEMSLVNLAGENLGGLRTCGQQMVSNWLMDNAAKLQQMAEVEQEGKNRSRTDSLVNDAEDLNPVLMVHRSVSMSAVADVTARDSSNKEEVRHRSSRSKLTSSKNAIGDNSIHGCGVVRNSASLVCLRDHDHHRQQQTTDSHHHHQPDTRNSSPSAIKSAYSTDSLIKACSGNPDYFLQIPCTASPSPFCVEMMKGPCEGAGAAAGATVVPPAPSASESEAWSEPDRNVSLARIGLEQSMLALSERNSSSRTRLAARSSQKTTDSEAVTERRQSVAKRLRTEVIEIRRLQGRVRSLEQLNETLRAELSIYQQLSDQRMEQMEHEEKAVESTLGQAAVDAHVQTSFDSHMKMAVPEGLLSEIKSLRVKLEEAIGNNDELRRKLEAAVQRGDGGDGTGQDELVLCLKITQEQLQDSHEKLRQAQTVSQDYKDRLRQTLDRLAEAEREGRKESQAQAAVKELEANNEQLRRDARDYTEKIAALETDIEGLRAKAAQLEKKCADSANECELRLRSSTESLLNKLNSSETLLIELNKEKMRLLSDKTQLMSQIRLLRSESSLLDKEKVQLMSERTRLEGDMEIVRTKLSVSEAERERMGKEVALLKDRSKAEELEKRLKEENREKEMLQRELDALKEDHQFKKPLVSEEPKLRRRSRESAKLLRIINRQRSEVNDSDAPGDDDNVPDSDQSQRASVYSSPDLGIESDFRFSSLERRKKMGGTNEQGDAVGAQKQPKRAQSAATECGHEDLMGENHRLREERSRLETKLSSTKQALREALERLSAANRRKKSVERAISKQVTKTHTVLRLARENMTPRRALRTDRSAPALREAAPSTNRASPTSRRSLPTDRCGPSSGQGVTQSQSSRSSPTLRQEEMV